MAGDHDEGVRIGVPDPTERVEPQGGGLIVKKQAGFGTWESGGNHPCHRNDHKVAPRGVPPDQGSYRGTAT